MKKIYLLFIGLAFILSSCTSDNSELISNNSERNSSEIVSTSTNNKSLQDLKSELILLNNRTFGDFSNGGKPQTRGFFKKLLNKILNFVVADAGGAIKGLISGNNVWTSAKTASISTLRSAFKSIGEEVLRAPAITNDTINSSVLATSLINPRDIALKDVVPVNIDVKDSDLDSIGYYHNKVIMTLFEKNNDALYWANLPADKIELEVKGALEKEAIFERLSLDTIGINRHEMIDFYDNLSNALNSTDDSVELCDKIHSLNPDMADLLSILSVYIDGLENVQAGEEWTNYTNEMLNIVNNSKVDELMKRNIRSSLIVAFASSKLWKP